MYVRKYDAAGSRDYVRMMMAADGVGDIGGKGRSRKKTHGTKPSVVRPVSEVADDTKSLQPDASAELGITPDGALSFWPNRITDETVISHTRYDQIVNDHPDRRLIERLEELIVETVRDPEVAYHIADGRYVVTFVKAIDQTHDLHISLHVSHDSRFKNLVLTARKQKGSLRLKEKSLSSMIWEKEE